MSAYTLYLQALIVTASGLLAPQHAAAWTTAATELTDFSPSMFPSVLEEMVSLFRTTQSHGLQEEHLQVVTLFDSNDEDKVVEFTDSMSGRTSSVHVSPPHLAQNVSVTDRLDIVLVFYPTLASLLPPSLPTHTVASPVVSVQAWAGGGEGSEARTLLPISLSLAHSRKVLTEAPFDGLECYVCDFMHQ